MDVARGSYRQGLPQPIHTNIATPLWRTEFRCVYLLKVVVRQYYRLRYNILQHKYIKSSK